MFFDIHSHILPEIDDGAENLNETLKLLKLMQLQGITDVIATPHFYPAEDNLENFLASVDEAFKKVKDFSVKRSLPNIYLGCEFLYFEGISHAENLSQFCLNGTEYMLLELTEGCVNDALFEDIIRLREIYGIEPIIAHVERYSDAKNYRKFIKFLEKNNVPIQINASSVLIPQLNRVIKKLLNSSLFVVLASDTHSVEVRPPQITEALEHISKAYGEENCKKLIKNSEILYNKLITNGALND